MRPDLADTEVLRDHNSRTHIAYATGRQYIHAVVLDGSVKLATLPLDARRKLKPLTLKSEPYPLKRAVRALLRAGRTLGISDGARDVLNEMKGML